MKISLKLPKPGFAVSETISLDVTLVNDAMSAVEIPDPFHAFNWQPTYTIVGPAYPNGFTFSFLAVKRKQVNPDTTGLEPQLLTLAPGEEITSDIPLGDWIPLVTPGRYQLRAQFEWQGIHAVSDPVAFDIEPLAIVATGVGLDVGCQTIRYVPVGWLRDGQQGRALGESLYYEKRPDLGEFKRLSASEVMPVGAAASEVLVPFTDYDRRVALTYWRAWREGGTICAHLAGAAEVSRAELGPSTIVIRPALMTEAGQFDVFAFDGATNEVLLARFAPGVPPQVIRGPRLPGRCVAGRAALDSPAHGAQRHVVVPAVDEDGSLLVNHVAFGADGQVVTADTIAIPQAKALTGSSPALRRIDDGRLQVALLAETELRGAAAAATEDLDAAQQEAPSARGLALVEFAFVPAGTEAPMPRVSPKGRLSRAVWAARTSFVMAPEAGDRIDWVVALEGGDILTSVSPGFAAKPDLPLAFPLEIVSLAKGAYLLALDPSSEPEFILLR